jgi:hypothetical protein
MQDLQQKLASAGFLQGVGQQDFQNSLNAQQGAVNSRINAQSGNINMANQANQAGLMNAQQQNQNQQNMLRNVFGGAGAGMDLYKGITGNMPNTYGTGLNQSEFGALPSLAQQAYKQASIGNVWNPETGTYSA